MNEKWQTRFLGLAHEVASWSKDLTKVGAVIVDANRNPRGFGYNGMPRGLDDTLPDRMVRPVKWWMWEHAERNCLYAAARNGISCDGCTILVTHAPCCDCTRGIIQSGIIRVIVDEACMNPAEEFYQKWHEQIEVSRAMMAECGVDFQTVSMKA
jgi:dCMP deaminase